MNHTSKAAREALTVMVVIGALSLCAAEPWTLEKALEKALSENPDVRLAQQRIQVARTRLEQANAGFWPRLQAQGSYMRTDNPMQVFGSILNQRAYSTDLDFNDVPDVDNFNAKGMVTLPLYTGGRLRADRGAAVASQESARFDNEAVRNQLGFEVARAFHTVLKTREFVRAAETTVRAYETNLGIATCRVAAGASLKVEVLGLQVRLAQAREDLLRAQNSRGLAERALRNLLGIEEGEFTVAETAPAVSAPATLDFSERPELAAAHHREKAAVEQARSVRSGHLPRVSAFGSLDYDYGWKFEEGGKSYSAGALAQWDLWDGKLTRARVREAKANMEMTREETRKLRLALDYELEQARLNLQSAAERVAVATNAVAQAFESAELNRSRFDQGLTLATALIEAETALLEARVRQAEAEADLRIAVAAARKAMGLPQLDPPEKPLPR